MGCRGRRARERSTHLSPDDWVFDERLAERLAPAGVLCEAAARQLTVHCSKRERGLQDGARRRRERGGEARATH